MAKVKFDKEIITEEVKDEVVEEVKEEIAEEVKEETKYVKIKKQFSNFKVNIRKDTGLSSEIVDQISKDDVVELINGSLTDKWVEVSKGSTTGFAMSEYLEKSE